MITLVSGLDEITIHPPQYGHTVNMHLAFNPVRFGLNVDSFDMGTEYDFRTLDMELLLPHSEMKELVDFFNDTDARQSKFILRLPAKSGFYAAGPDRRDQGDYEVSLYQPQDQSGMLLAPFKWFSNRLQLLIHDTPAVLIPTAATQGPFAIGTVHGLRYPDITPSPDHAITRSRTMAGELTTVDMGRAADEYTTSISQPCNVSLAAGLVAFLESAGGRNNNIFVQAPTNYFLFGPECNGAGNYTVKLLNSIIPITHTSYDQFTIDLELWRKNG